MSELREVQVPDIGDFDLVDVVEVLVSVGDRVGVDDSLITLESDKASMEIPSPVAGTVAAIEVKVGDQIGEGALIARLEVEDGTAEPAVAPDKVDPVVEPAAEAELPAAPTVPPEAPATERDSAPSPVPIGRTAPAESSGPETDRVSPPHASPSLRRFARELGADLTRVEGSGAKGRILRQDVQAFVKRALAAAPAAAGGLAIPPIPEVDFSAFGEIETRELSRIRRVSARNVHRSWLNVPHVTQFDEADITDLEEFRKGEKEAAAAKGVRLTPLAFVMKAAVAALREFPDVNSSLAPSGESLILKRYYHLGVAVDTPEGLMVPVIRDVDTKSIYQLAVELAEVSERARARKLNLRDLQGASFTISSLGGIGGTGFTPIVNAPEVAILGVARSQRRPVHQDGEWVPRLILPFSLAYDHRVIDGAAAVRFTTFLARVLGDLRRLLL